MLRYNMKMPLNLFITSSIIPPCCMWIWEVYKDTDQGLNSQKTPHNPPSRASYGVSVVSILDKKWGYKNVTLPTGIMDRTRQNCGISRPQGVGVTKPISSVSLFSLFFIFIKSLVALSYHIHIRQVSLQLNCWDTWQIWTWLEEFKL